MDQRDQQSTDEYLNTSENESNNRTLQLAGWSSTKRKVESVAEKVSWSSAGLSVADHGDSYKVESQALLQTASSSSKWLSSQQVTENFSSDNVARDDGDSLVVVCNRSARRMETHSESIVTRKVRSQIIEMDDDEDCPGEDGFYEEEQLIVASSGSNDGEPKDSELSTKSEVSSTQIESSVNQVKSNAKATLFTASKEASISACSTTKLIKSAWSSEAMESIESVESYIEESETSVDELQASQDDNNQQGHIDSI